jgi:hypothetical protein
MKHFSVGEKVLATCAVGGFDLINQVGTIKAVCNYTALVEFSSDIRGHGENGNEWWIEFSSLKSLYIFSFPKGAREELE